MKCCRCHSFAINIDPKRNLCDVCYYKRPLLDLLAVIHRDGGHYTEKHGLEKSVEDAKKEIANMDIELKGQQGM